MSKYGETSISSTIPRHSLNDMQSEESTLNQKNIETFQESISSLICNLVNPFNNADIETLIRLLTQFNEENSKLQFERQPTIEIPSDCFLMLNDLISIPHEMVGICAIQTLNIISSVFNIPLSSEQQESFFSTLQHYLDSESVDYFLQACKLLSNIFHYSDIPLEAFPLYNIIINKAQDIEGPGIVDVLESIYIFVQKFLLKGYINLNNLFPLLSTHIRLQKENDEEVLQALKIISYCFMSNYPGTVTALKNTQLFIFLSALTYSNNPKIIESALHAIGFAIINFNCPELLASDLDYERLISIISDGVAVAEAAPCIAAIIDKKADDGTISIPGVVDSFVAVASKEMGFRESCAVLYMLTKAIMNAGEGDLEQIDLPTVVALLADLLGVGNNELEEQILEALLVMDDKAKSINQGEAFAEIVASSITADQLDYLISNSSEAVSEMAEQLLSIIQPE